MTDTLSELEEKLKGIDEVSLLELLEINSEMLIERFHDLIDENIDKLREVLE
jgi:hypothetical protein